MRKATFIPGLALALFGVASVATAQGQNRQERPRGAQADSGFHRGPGGRGGRGPEGMLLRGITLTADQKTRIAAIGERERKAFEANRPKGEKGGQGRNGQARPQRQRGDTAAFAARRAEMEKRREQHVAELRTVLTSEQRVQFDRNVAEMKQRFSQRMGGERGQKGERPRRG